MAIQRANLYQSTDLMRFIRPLKVNVAGDLVTNVIDDELNFISRFYTPHFRVNQISSTILDMIYDNNITEVNKQLSKDSLTYKLQMSGLSIMAPEMYKLSRLVVLECFALIYAIEEEQELFKYIDEQDVMNTRENVKYLVDYLGEQKDYIDIVMDLHSVDVALGYIQKQIPLIQGELEVNGTI